MIIFVSRFFERKRNMCIVCYYLLGVTLPVGYMYFTGNRICAVNVVCDLERVREKVLLTDCWAPVCSL